MNYRKFIMWSSVIGIAFSVSTFSWIRSAYMLKNVIDMTKYLWYFITTYIYSYLNIYPVINKSRSHVSSTRRFYFTQQFCFILVWIHISQIFQISTIWEKSEPRISNYMGPIFFRSKAGLYFSFFCYILCLYFVSSRMFQF